ncbi:CgeB family protein [Paludifilum halophilum]|uniref:Spore protein YkvP/CgeB glycosyl transferase-like domain-containing protein n=1 Tax=Paludifilum halophilum TaxID=1642702 RepID=A0A235B9F5_9BACL|nr:glycosyltransferase [Paludifilum halophilum]OYD08924.1 hypothetical protein CHM34_03855 [Paludifilum halophilum]
MRLLYVSSGSTSLSHLDPNIIGAFRQLSKKLPYFQADSFLPDRSSLSDLIKKIHVLRPHIVLVFRASLPPNTVYYLKKRGMIVGLWEVDDPYNIQNHERKARPYHFVVTQDAGCVSRYRQLGKPCIHLPLAVNPDKYRPLTVSEKYRSDICFVGSALPIRVRMFDQLAPFLLQKDLTIVGQWWDRLKQYDQLKPCILNETVPPREAAKYYNGAKIVLNIHRTRNDIDQNPLRLPAYTPNNRTFDIAACRSFQLISHRRDLQHFFEIEKEIVPFRGLDDLKNKIDYYLIHDEEREQIAARAYRRTLREHTYTARMRTLLYKLYSQILKPRKRRMARG